MQLTTATITQNSRQLSQSSTEITSNLILVVGDTRDLEHLPFGDVIAARLRERRHRLSDASFTTDLPNRRGTHLSIATIDPARTPFEILTLARELVAEHQRAEQLTIACVGLAPALADRACEAVVAAALARSFALPTFKHRQTKERGLREIRIFGHRRPDGYARTLAEAKGNNLARYLTALPVNELTPTKYRRRVEALAREYGWQSTFFDERRLRARGAGAFLAVAQGSPKPDAGLLHLRYRPKKRRANAPLLALVGKGICFDTGGTNLKSAKSMYGMHEDMEGSAVALGTLLALTELGVDFPVDCWLALAQNHIGPNAYRPNEVVTAANGTTIEIIHTDAEGRMVLADALHFAAQAGPKLVIDYATLTGACVQALSTRQSGAFSNRLDLIPTVMAAGMTSGERVWPFPLDADYEKELKSDIADIKQCTLGSEADHILAAVFLRRFIKQGNGEPDWLHLDLASGNHKGGLAHIPTDVTGFGVRFTLNLLLEQQVLTL